MSPSAVDPQPQQDKFDQKSLIQIDKMIDKSIIDQESQEWPTIFRPKSTTAASSNGNNQKQVNPGVVPSPEKFGGPSSRKSKPVIDNSKIDQQSISIEDNKRRSSLDEKLKSILQDHDPQVNDQLITSDKPAVVDNTLIADKTDKDAFLSVIRRNHLPPLHIDIGIVGDQVSISQQSPRKISNNSDSDKASDKKQSVMVSPKRKKSLSVSTDKPTDDPSISGLPSINSGRSIITDTDKDISLSQARVIRIN